MLDQSVPERLHPMGGTPSWSQGREGREERKGSKTNVRRTDHKPHSLYLCAAEEEDGEDSGVKLSPGRREGQREGAFKV